MKKRDSEEMRAKVREEGREGKEERGRDVVYAKN